MVKVKSSKKQKAGVTELPVDKGWAWVIVAACAGLFMLIAGTFKCFGILKLEVEQQFPECPARALLWIFSAASIISLLSGPLCSWLLNKSCHRVVGMVGGGLCSLGIFLSAFAPNCYFLFFSLALYSLGAGGVMVVVYTAFADYFSKHRALAVGIVAAGSGLGGLVIPLLINYLFSTYAFREALICYAAVFLKAIVFAALLRPMSYYKNQLTTNKPDAESSEDQSADQPPPKYSEESEDHEDMDLGENDTSTSSLTSADTKESLTEKLLIEDAANMECLDVTNNNLHIGGRRHLYDSVYSLSIGAPFASTLSLDKDEDNIIINNKHHGGAIDIDNNTTKTTSKSKHTTSCGGEEASTDCCHGHCKLWANYRVLLIGFLVFFAVNGINLIYTTAPSYAVENGLKKKKVTYIMLYTAIAEILMRVLHGLFADRRIISALAQICIIMVLCTLGSALCAALPGLAGISIIYSTMALCGTTIYSLLPIVVIELIGKEHLVTTMGIYYLYQAVAFIVSTLVANALHEAFDEWVVVFYYIGACYFLAAVIGISTFLGITISKCRRIKTEPKPIVTLT